MDSLIETFHIDWKLLVAQIINFGLVFFVLYFYALKPLMKKMSERSEKIEQGLVDARAHREKLDAAEAAYKKTITEARTEAQQILQDAKTNAKVKQEEMINEARAEVSQLLEKSKQQITAEKDKMVREAKAELGTLVTLATRRVLGDAVDKDIDQRIISKHL